MKKQLLTAISKSNLAFQVSTTKNYSVLLLIMVDNGNTLIRKGWHVSREAVEKEGQREVAFQMKNNFGDKNGLFRDRFPSYEIVDVVPISAHIATLQNICIDGSLI